MKHLIAALLLVPAIALTAGTTATVTITYPAEGTRLNQITGQQETVPIAIADIQKAVIKWYAGSTQVGSIDLIAPATKIQVPGLVCGNYSFTANVVMKTGVAGPDYTPPVPYATGVECTTVPKAPGVSAS